MKHILESSISNNRCLGCRSDNIFGYRYELTSKDSSFYGFRDKFCRNCYYIFLSFKNNEIYFIYEGREFLFTTKLLLQIEELIAAINLTKLLG